MRHHKIKKLTVTGGFLDGLDVHFSDGLVCIIGGRGSGKTTILELIRFALDQMPDAVADDKRALKRFKDLISANLDHGTVEVEFETQEGLVYTVQRTAGQSPIVNDINGNPVNPSILESGILIDAAIFSQNEVEEIALQSSYLREVIDRFCAKELGEVQHRIAQTVESLSANASDIVQITLQEQRGREAVRDLPGYESKLAKVREDVGKVQLDAGLEDASSKKELRTRETTAMDRVRPALYEARRVLTPLQKGIVWEFQQVFSDDIVAGPNGAIFETLRKTMREEYTRFRDAVAQAGSALSRMEDITETAKRELVSAHQPQESSYQELAKKHKVHQQLLAEMHALTRQVAQLKAQQEEAESFKRRLTALHEVRDQMLATFSDLTEQRFQIRAGVAKRLNVQLNGRIQVRVEQNAEHSLYFDFLIGHRDPNTRQYNRPLERIAQKVPPSQLARMAKGMDVDGLASEVDLDENFARATLKMIMADPRTLFELEVVGQEDIPYIELLVGNQWRASNKLSAGQMCSVVLPLLLLETVAPLLVDQPEDNLDNCFVTDLLIEQIRKNRDQRQMILITHNPNIPVLGLADQVIAMRSDGERGWVENQGNTDMMRNPIVELLEGGEKAFLARQEKYGW
jgi:DNA repair ATPase RecN